ncbi:MAG: immunoglobulin domain-containing protein [Crocinitomicaceae bacterium]|nr:immunoglobulin domain-containing protein [Crocinitomicaceae bacterium]
MNTSISLKMLALIAWILSAFTAVSQVGINVNGDNPDPSSALDVSSTSKGVLISRMTQSERDNISNPAFGLLIFNTTTSCINMWIGTTWRQMCGTCDFPDPVPSNNGPICSGQTLNLSASSIPGATYQWTGPGGFNSTLQNPSIPNALAGMSGSYSVTAAVNGCTTLAQSTVATVNDIPNTPTATATPNPICGTNTLNLSSTTIPGASYLWSGPDNFSSSSQDPEISNVQVYQSGNYNVVATVLGCASAAGSVNVTVNDPTPNTPGIITGLASACGGSTGNTYSITAVPGATNYVWTVPAGSTIDSGQGTTSIAVTFGNNSGNITVTAGNSCGTSSPSSLSVSITAFVVLNPPYVFNGKQVFSYTGSSQNFTVPSCATQIYVKLWGAGGGGDNDNGRYGGAGAFVSGYLPTTPGQNLSVIVAGRGVQNGTNNVSGGFGGGGNTGTSAQYKGASGGGRSAIQLSGTELVTAGGGGGAGGVNNYDAYGGGGGALNGANGGGSDGGYGRGGTTTAGGASGSVGNPGGVGSFLQGGQGGSTTGSGSAGGGGGGGGYYGGGGGSGSNSGFNGEGGGGGGSSYTANLSSVINIAGQSNSTSGTNIGDVDYASGISNGGPTNNAGGHGRVVIYW